MFWRFEAHKEGNSIYQNLNTHFGLFSGFCLFWFDFGVILSPLLNYGSIFSNLRDFYVLLRKKLALLY